MDKTFFKNYWDAASKNYKHNRWHKNNVTLFDYLWTKKKLLEELEPTKKDSILEIGCGPGTWTSIVGRKSKRLFAVDISNKMIGLARKKTRKTSFAVSDAMKFNTKETFDKIFSVRVIEYIFDKGGFVRKMSGLLNKGGKFVIITKSKPNLWDISSKSEWQRKISPKSLAKIMRGAGFRNVHYQPISIRFPIFSKGVYEFRLVPAFLEKPFLCFFTLLTKLLGKSSFLIFFSESYIISGKKQ